MSNAVTVAIKFKNRVAPRVWDVRSEDDWQVLKDAVKSTPGAKYDPEHKLWFISPEGLKQLEKRFVVVRRDFYVDNRNECIRFTFENTPISFEFVNEFGGRAQPDWKKLDEICQQLQAALNESDAKFREVINSIPRRYVVK